MKVLQFPMGGRRGVECRLRPRRILVVEDEPAVRNLLAEELEDEGFRVTACKNGLAALSEIPFGSIDAVVTDWKLPLRDGLMVMDVAREVRPDLPVVVMTAFPDDTVRRRVREAGSVYLTKPFSMESFKRLMGSILRA